MATNFIEVTTSENFQLDRPEMIDKTLLKSDFMPYRPHSIAGINDTAPFNITISRQDAFIDIRDSYLEMEVQILKTDNTLYADNDAIQPNNLFGISLFRQMAYIVSVTRNWKMLKMYIKHLLCINFYQIMKKT